MGVRATLVTALGFLLVCLITSTLRFVFLPNSSIHYHANKITFVFFNQKNIFEVNLFV